MAPAIKMRQKGIPTRMCAVGQRTRSATTHHPEAAETLTKPRTPNEGSLHSSARELGRAWVQPCRHDSDFDPGPAGTIRPSREAAKEYSPRRQAVGKCGIQHSPSGAKDGLQANPSLIRYQRRLVERSQNGKQTESIRRTDGRRNGHEGAPHQENHPAKLQSRAARAARGQTENDQAGTPNEGSLHSRLATNDGRCGQRPAIE